MRRIFKIAALAVLLFLLIFPLLLPLRSFSQSVSHGHSEIIRTLGFTRSPLSRFFPGQRFNIDVIWKSPTPWSLESLDLTIGTYITKPILLSAKITGPNCEMRSPWWSSLQDNMYLRFDAVGTCQVKAGDHLSIVIKALRAPGLAIMTLGDQSPNADILPDQETTKPSSIMSIIQGAPIDTPTPQSIHRFEALAEFWGISPAWFMAGILIFAGSIALAIWLLSKVEYHKNKAVLSLLLFGCCAYSAFISPPMQGPDEAAHFISYLSYSNQFAKIDEAYKWMRRIHYPRINCQISACIATPDLATPSQIAIPENVVVNDISSRSALGAVQFSVYSWLASGLQMQSQLLGLRLLNSLLAGIFLFVSLHIFWGSTKLNDTLALTLAAIPIAVPTFSFLIMHANNHGLIISGYISLLIGCLGLCFRKMSYNLKQWVWIGFLLAWTVLSGRTGFGGALILAPAILLTYLATSTGKEKRWIGPAVASFVFILFVGVFAFSPYLSAQVPAVKDRVASAVQEGTIPGLIATGICILFGIFAFVYRQQAKIAIDKIKVWQRHEIVSFEKWGIAFACATVFLLVYPLAFKTPVTPDIEFLTNPLSRWQFTALILKTFWLNLGLSGQDFFIHWSLWAGFGCPDRAVPNIFIQVTKGLLLSGLGFGLAFSARKKQFQTLNILTFGLVFSMLWMILVSRMLLPHDAEVGINPHGRFFMGTALIFTFIGVYGLNASLKAASREIYLFFLTVLFGICGIGIGSWFWLERFFR